MNERIRELAEKADPDHWHKRWYSGINPRVMDPEIQKFVELIVKECFQVVDEYGVQRSGRKDEKYLGENLLIGVEICNGANKIKEHFGVE